MHTHRTNTSGDEEPDKNSELKSERRAAAAERARRASSRPSQPEGSRSPSRAKARWRDRHLTVRGVLREQPDFRKLARAAIQIALAETEARAQAAEPRITEESS
ncbi:MAG: hypothetical protein ACRCYU_17955 [Nocardioides sp.]